MRVSSFEEAVARYGEISMGTWADETKWCSIFRVPEEIHDIGKWINVASGYPVSHIYCNNDMHEPLSDALGLIISRGLIAELETFDGCFSIRDVRGEPGKPSAHSYALAIDINAAKNKLGQPPTLSPGLVACFTENGFTWGGAFHRLDGMHLSYSWERAS